MGSWSSPATGHHPRLRAEEVLLDLVRGGPPRAVPDDVRTWVRRIAPDPVFCSAPGLQEAGWDLLRVVLVGVPNLTEAELVSLSAVSAREPRAVRALLSHPAAGDLLWLEALWASSRAGVVVPEVSPPSPLAAAALSLYHPARSLGFGQWEGTVRRLAVSPAAVEVFTTLLADRGNPWELLLSPPEVWDLVDAALSLSSAKEV